MSSYDGRETVTVRGTNISNCEGKETNYTAIIYPMAVPESKLGFSFLEHPPPTPGVGMVYQLFHFSGGQD